MYVSRFTKLMEYNRHTFKEFLPYKGMSPLTWFKVDWYFVIGYTSPLRNNVNELTIPGRDYKSTWGNHGLSNSSAIL